MQLWAARARRSTIPFLPTVSYDLPHGGAEDMLSRGCGRRLAEGPVAQHRRQQQGELRSIKVR